MRTFYLTPHITHPWSENTQYEVSCETMDEAVRAGKLLSAVLVADVNVSPAPGIHKGNIEVESWWVKDGNIKRINN